MTASNSEVIRAFAVQAINYSSRDIIGEFVDELFSATDSQYRNVIEDHVERFSNETIELIPDLDSPEFRFTLHQVTEALLMSAV